MAQNFGNRNKTHYLSAFEISYKFHNQIIAQLNQLMAISRLTNMVEARMAQYIEENLKKHNNDTFKIS